MCRSLLVLLIFLLKHFKTHLSDMHLGGNLMYYFWVCNKLFMAALRMSPTYSLIIQSARCLEHVLLLFVSYIFLNLMVWILVPKTFYQHSVLTSSTHLPLWGLCALSVDLIDGNIEHPFLSKCLRLDTLPSESHKISV